MRILHVCGPTSGGTAVVVRDLVDAGLSRGYEVAVACPNEGDLRGWVEALGATWYEVDLRRAPGLADFAAARAIHALLGGFDVLHLHSSKAGALGRIAVSRKAGGPRVVFTPHAWSWYVGGRFATAYKRFEKWAAQRTDVIVAVSAGELADGRDVLGPTAPLTLIENGVDTLHFTPSGTVAARSKTPQLVTVGRLSEQKGQDRLVKVLAALPDTSVTLRIIGSGPDELRLRALAAELEVTDRIDFAGSLDPRASLRAADVVVLPSRWEGMSLVLLEAMACGCAVIATECGGTDALQGVGIVIAQVDEASLLAELTLQVGALLADDEQRHKLGVLARQRVEERHDIRQVQERYAQAWTGAVQPASD